MAYSGVWGCYIHIPKTGGMWVKRVLGAMGPGHKDGASHGLPENWKHDRIFCTTRHPAEWLASVWAHRVRHKWDEYNGNVPWRYLCKLLSEYQSNDFAEFVENVTLGIPGVIDWFWSIHIPPTVQVVRLKGAPAYLAELGADPDAIPPQNVGTNTPKLTEDALVKIYTTNAGAYIKYGYSRWPDVY